MSKENQGSDIRNETFFLNFFLTQCTCMQLQDTQKASISVREKLEFGYWYPNSDTYRVYEFGYLLILFQAEAGYLDRQ